jgi:hypothetical protein
MQTAYYYFEFWCFIKNHIPTNNINIVARKIFAAFSPSSQIDTVTTPAKNIISAKIQLISHFRRITPVYDIFAEIIP